MHVAPAAQGSIWGRSTQIRSQFIPSLEPYLYRHRIATGGQRAYCHPTASPDQRSWRMRRFATQCLLQWVYIRKVRFATQCSLPTARRCSQPLPLPSCQHTRRKPPPRPQAPRVGRAQLFLLPHQRLLWAGLGPAPTSPTPANPPLLEWRAAATNMPPAAFHRVTSCSSSHLPLLR